MEREYYMFPTAPGPLYDLLAEQLPALLEGTRYSVSILSNASALLNQALQNINWVGFYLLRDDILVLGPFQGKTACIEISRGHGVCGTAVAQDATQLVEDVHSFPGHIACDSASNSEIVVPLHVNGTLYGVLDIDSPLVGRFTEADREGLERLAHLIEQALAAAID